MIGLHSPVCVLTQSPFVKSRSIFQSFLGPIAINLFHLSTHDIESFFSQGKRRKGKVCCDPTSGFDNCVSTTNFDVKFVLNARLDLAKEFVFGNCFCKIWRASSSVMLLIGSSGGLTKT